MPNTLDPFPYSEADLLAATREAAGGFPLDPASTDAVLSALPGDARACRGRVMARLNRLAHEGKLRRTVTGSGRGTRYAWAVPA